MSGQPDDAYDRLARDRPRTVSDWTERWNQLHPISEADERARDELERFCERKRIEVAALEALGARVWRHKDFGYCLAFASNGNGKVTAIKYRPLTGSSHDSWTERPSRWLRPIVVGNRDSLAWLIAEGETDGARLYGLVGDRCAILVLPTGARAEFQASWADLIPRGATVGLCHDADPDGDEGAAKAARVIGGRTVRVRPPVEGGDWCDWPGDREAFEALVQAAVKVSEVPEVELVTLEAFAAVDEPGAEPLVGPEGEALIAEGSDVMLYGDGGTSKTTLGVDLACHLATGRDWLGMKVARPVRVLLIEGEGPRPQFRKKLARKMQGWTGPPLDGRVLVLDEPWAEFTFNSEERRESLAQQVAALEVDVVIAGPLVNLGMDEHGTLQEVRAFLRLVKDLRRRSGRSLTVLLIHHENKSGDVSGQWAGSGDTLLHAMAAGHGKTTLFVQKARHSSTMHLRTLHLAWADGEGFAVVGESGAKRDLLREVKAFMADGEWRTARDIAAPREPKEPEPGKEPKQPGIGANSDDVKDVLEAHPDVFEVRTGKDAQAVGRSSLATVYRLPRGSEAVEAVTDSLWTDDATALLPQPYIEAVRAEEVGPDASSPSLPTQPSESVDNDVSDAAVVRDAPKLHLVEDEGEHADPPKKPPKGPNKPTLAAPVIRELLPADGEWHPATPIRAKLAERGLASDTTLTDVKDVLKEQGFVFAKRKEPGMQRGDRARWKLTPIAGAAQMPLDVSEPDPPVDEKSAANDQLLADAHRFNRSQP